MRTGAQVMNAVFPQCGKKFSTVWKPVAWLWLWAGIPAQAANLISESIQSWTSRASYGTYTQSIVAGTVNLTQCIVAPTGAASGTGSTGYVQMQATSGILQLPAVNTVGTVTCQIRAGGTGRTLILQKNVNGAGWVVVTTWTGIGTTGASFAYTLNEASTNVALRLASPSAAVYVHDIVVTDYVVAPTITLADNGTQVMAANVAAGTAAQVLHRFQIGVATANATLTAVAFTTAGTYVPADIANLKLRYSADATLDAGDATLATMAGPAAAGAKSFSAFSQTINSGATGYFFITMDVAASPTGGHTIGVNAISTGDLTFASGTKSGSTTAGGVQTLLAASTPTITVSAGTLAFGNAQQNGISSEQSYTVSGANQTANLVLTPPAGFEISTTSGSGFVANPSTLTLTPSGGTVPSTTIYVRFKPTAITSYSANITHTSTGAATQNKATTGTGIASSASDIHRDGSFNEPENVAYASYREADLTASSLEVGRFTIRDGGTSADLDSAGTTLGAITFNVANSANLRRVALYDGSTELGEVAGGATATFTGLTVTAPDDGTRTLSLRASFQDTVTDNQQVSFTVSSATAALSGSGFAEANAGGVATSMGGDRNRIEVTAARLAFSSIPGAPVDVGAAFAASVRAEDALANLDVDSAASVVISRGTGTGTAGGGGAQLLSAGEGTFGALTYDVAESFSLQATASGLTPGTSGGLIAKVDAPAVLSATAAGAVQNDLSWTRNAMANDVLVVRHTAAIAGTPSGAYAAGDEFPGGGTVVAAGGGTTASDVGLGSCTPYQYKAWSVAGSGPSYSAAGVTASATTATPDAPAGLVAIPSSVDFASSWTAVTGAAGYQVDVSTNATFGGAGGLATNVWEDFAGFTATNGSTDRSSSLNTYLRTNGWTGAAIYENAYEAKLGSGSTRGYIVTPTLNLSGNGGAATLIFDSRRWSGDSTVLQVYHAADGTTFVQSGSDIALTDTMATYSQNLTGGTANSKVRIYAKNASNFRYYLDNVAVRQGAAFAPDFVAGYSNRAVAGAAVVVTGLLPSVTYYYRVRSEGAGGCASTNSATASVTTTTQDPATLPPQPLEFVAMDSRAVSNEATDHALGHGGVALSVSLYHSTGMALVGTSYDLLAPDGSPLWSGRPFDAVEAVTLGGTNGQKFIAIVPGFFPAPLGVYTARVVAVSSNGMVITNTGCFATIDQDVAGPVHDGFSVAGKVFTTNMIAGGLVVTGLVSDASGVWAGSSNRWALSSNGVVVASGSLGMLPNVDGEGTPGSPAELSTVIPTNFLTPGDGIDYVLSVISTDFDTDRDGDSLSSTNSYGFSVIGSAPEAPLSVVAVADGAEMTRLVWNQNGAPEVLVLWNSKPVVEVPVQGQTYTAGDSIGSNGTRVAYRGAGEGSEWTVPMRSTNYYRLFGAAGKTYSAGSAVPMENPVVTRAYEDEEVIDQMAYTNGFTLAQNGLATGQGWSGGWAGDTGKWTVASGSLSAGSSGFPDPYANRVAWENGVALESSAIVRKLETGKPGRLFVAFMMSYENGDEEKRVGLSLMSGTNAAVEELFFGKVAGENRRAGIVDAGTAQATVSAVELTPGMDQVHMIVCEWEPAQKTARMWAFDGSLTIPPDYTNAVPIATYSNAAMAVGTITGVRLSAGCGASGAMGKVSFDEVRLGALWDEALYFNYPKAFQFSAGVQLNGTNVVTDGELSEEGKAYPVRYQLYHRTGVTNAQFTIVTNLADLGGLYGSQIPLALDPANAGSAYRAFTNMVTNRLSPGDVALGVHTSRVWMTAVSGKTTNTLFMEGQAGASDLFFGEFGEGNGYDKYVEIYNGSGGAIDLSQYLMANQMNPSGAQTNDYTLKGWANFCRLAPTTTMLGHGETMLVLNGAPSGKIDPSMTNALKNAVPPRPYVVTTNDVLTVSGDDPVALFRVTNTNQWIDACGIGPSAARYIMRRLENAEVPRSFPRTVDPAQWDYRVWDGDRLSGYTNFLATAGVYDRNVGLGGYTTFTVVDDDVEPPLMGTNSALMVGTSEPYGEVPKREGTVEMVLTAWNFYTNAAIPNGAAPWSGSLMTNAVITWIPTYTNTLIDSANAGTSENDLFGNYDSPNAGAINMAGLGTYFTNKATNTAWIQFEFNLPSATDRILSWAEVGGANGWSNAVVQWSGDGVNFNTNGAWPSWNPTDGGEWVTRTVGFEGVVTPGLARVFIRILLGPGFKGDSGYYRMDNVQLTGYPLEFQVTDGQLAASGNKLQFMGNLYDIHSGLNGAAAQMTLSSNTGARVAGRDVGNGRTSDSSLWWELPLTSSQITDWVNDSLSGNGLKIGVQVPDGDADREGDELGLDATVGSLRVTDDDMERPRVSLDTMRPQSSVLAQWAFTHKEYLPTKLDGSVRASELRTQSGAAEPKYPTFSSLTTNGSYFVEAYAWQASNKFWLIDVVPEVNTAITNLSFSSMFKQTYGVTHYRIEHHVNGSQSNVFGPFYFADPTNSALVASNWYNQSHGWASNQFVLQAGRTNQIRIYGLGASKTNGIGVRWKMWNLTLWQQALSTNGLTEVTDQEFSSGTFRLMGSAWDPDSGIVSATNETASKRPVYSLHLPSGAPLVANQKLDFTASVPDGGATTEVAGAFAADLARPLYTHVAMGEYTGSVRVVDFDEDRAGDELTTRADISLYVVDNDVTPPGPVGALRVNGELTGMFDRHSAPWTNKPDFVVSMESVATDQDASLTNSPKQRGVSGIGEYRVATSNVNSLAASQRATLGQSYPVAATNGALANYGFEMTGSNTAWVLDENCSLRSLAAGGTNDVKEGTNSLRQINGGVASQWIEFRNPAAFAPGVGISGWYRVDSDATPTLRIEAFATNQSTPIATRNIQPGTATAWTSFSSPLASLGDGTVEVLKISLVGGAGGTTFWDDLRLSVDIGTNGPSMRFVAGKENQGIHVTNYLFAVDADNDRAGDRLAGPAVPFVTAYDATPPTSVSMATGGMGASTLNVDDPTSQFDLQWNSANVGPDDPADARHPTGLGSDRDLLSPWKSYKIYYSTYNSPESPAPDFVYANFISNGVYRSWPSVTADSSLTDPTAAGYQANYQALTNAARNHIRLYGLEFDQEYAVVVVGLDRAGNEGPAGASSWATNNTIRFSMNRGLVLPKSEIENAFPLGFPLTNSSTHSAAALYWNAAGLVDEQGTYTAVTKHYDLIYWDSSSFQERTNNAWKWVGTVQTNWFVDDGGLGRGRGQLRFYRASYADRWRRTNSLGQAQRPLASEEIYALHNVVLSGGENYVALHGLPYTNTFAGVFGGLETFPGGSSALPLGGATIVEFFEPGVNAATSAQYYLNALGRWTQVGGGDVTDVPQGKDFFTRGFSIRLPKPLPAPYTTTTAVDKTQLSTNGLPLTVPAMVWSPIAQVPTNGFSQVIQTGSRSGMVSTLVYNIAALRLPVSVHPSEMKLLECGFMKGVPGWSDEIYTMDTTTKGVLNGKTIYCDTSGVWRFVSGNGLVPAGYFKPNDVLVIVSRNRVGDGHWTWTYHPRQFYALPTRWMEPAP